LVASLDQTITAVGTTMKKFSNTKPRFVEVISRKKTGELRLPVSITTKV